jgi:photosystem II stability/assembly factor-like uncharacterized protein
MLYEIRLTARWVGAAAAVSVLALAPMTQPVRAQGGGTSDTWVPIGPPGASSIGVLAIDPLTPTTIYASSFNTIFKSTDGGRSWTALTPFQGGITVMAIDPQTPTTLYAGWVQGFSGFVSRSTDGGASWSSTGGAWGGIGNVNALVINPRNPATVYMGQGADPQSLGGVYKSTNSGLTWTAAKDGLPDSSWSPPAFPGVNSMAIDPQAPDTLYAGGGGHGIYKTIDGGASWFVTGLTSGSGPWIVVDPGTPTTLYASVPTFVGGSSSLILYRSIDGGIAWTPFQNGLPSPVTAFAVDPHDSTALYAATGSGVFRSGDAGTSWTAMNDGLTHTVYELAIDGQIPTTLYAATSGGGAFVFRMTPRHTLSLQRMGDGDGVVTSSPAGINCGTDCTELFSEGTVVTLSAAPRAGSLFTSWSGCDAVEEDGECSVTMDGVRNVIATFDRQVVDLTVSTSGFRGGTVTSSPSGIDCGSDCSEWFTMGTVVTLTATPERGAVTGWNGCDSDSGPGPTSTCTVTMTAGRSVTTTFAPKEKKPKHEHHGH